MKKITKYKVCKNIDDITQDSYDICATKCPNGRDLMVGSYACWDRCKHLMLHDFENCIVECDIDYDRTDAVVSLPTLTSLYKDMEKRRKQGNRT